MIDDGEPLDEVSVKPSMMVGKAQSGKRQISHEEVAVVDGELLGVEVSYLRT